MPLLHQDRRRVSPERLKMQPSNFDELTKALATSTSRRHALRLIATASISGLLGLGGVSTAFGRHRHRARITAPSGGSKSNKNCAQWCAQVFGPNTTLAGQCASMATKGKGPCATCGNFSPSSICCTKTNPPSGPCTGGIVVGCICSDCQTCDYSNHTCPSSCSGSTPNCCSNSCTNTQSDSNNCGACGTVCSPGEICCSGVCKNTNTDASNCGQCGHACPIGQSCCSGMCVDTQTDSNHCGACGTVCPSGEACCQICDSGQCVTSNEFSCLCLDNATFGPICSTLACTDANGEALCAGPCASHQGVLRSFCGPGIC